MARLSSAVGQLGARLLARLGQLLVGDAVAARSRSTSAVRAASTSSAVRSGRTVALKLNRPGSTVSEKDEEASLASSVSTRAR